MTRKFEISPPGRTTMPLLVGLMGPSGSGKTYSALRLAKGIQSVSGGKIVVIDTERGRAKHYAQYFDFEHMPFNPPFGSLDYLDALTQAAEIAKGGVIVVDSMSHEHEGLGGMIDFQEKEVERMAGDDYRKRESVKMLAWSKPKAARRKLLNGIVQMNANMIFCFRAKETSKPVKNPQNGKTEVVAMGFTPIAGDEFLFEMTANCLLLPNAGGVPTWHSENMGERGMIKLPLQFRELFQGRHGQPLDETSGQALAQWARGGTDAKLSAPQPQQQKVPDEALVDASRTAAMAGVESYRQWFEALTRDDRAALLASGDHDSNKRAAQSADSASADFPGDR